MLKRPSRNAALAIAVPIAVGALAPVFATSAEAGIKCRGAYQVSGGRLIATLYCGEKQLASVARSYGIKTSFAKIRNSISEKEQVCAAIGHDTRVSDVCTGFRPSDDSGRRRF